MDIRKLFGKTIVRKSSGKHGTIENVDCYENYIDIWSDEHVGFYNFPWEEIEKAIKGETFVNDEGDEHIVII